MSTTGVTQHVFARQVSHLVARCNEALYRCRTAGLVAPELDALREAVIDLRPYLTAVVAQQGAQSKNRATSH